jgi:type II restriction enzyme
VPYGDFEEVFRNAQTASDGQYKVQLLSRNDGLELYVARQGRFNVEGYVGLEPIARSLDSALLREAHNLTHPQVQTLLAGIGHFKKYEVYVPEHDAGKLDWALTDKFALRGRIPSGFGQVQGILSEIDVIWIARGGEAIEGLFEVEHTTTVYSGLLRFNDILLTDPKVSRFSIVSNETRRSLFSRQLFRPTFRKSGLAELTSFLEYSNVLDWHMRMARGNIFE